MRSQYGSGSETARARINWMFTTDKARADKGWLWLHESGTYVKLTDAGAAMFA
jgi:hypothetical protein